MNTMIMSLFARTPVHVGTGTMVGIVDSPVQRERHTRIPIIPGSALKGVISDLWNEANDRSEEGKYLFGEGERAGALLIGEGRVLAFPVRSAKGMFAWLTCPLVLHRFRRDANKKFDVPAAVSEEAYAPKELQIDGKVILEEYCFNVKDSVPDTLVAALRGMVPNDDLWQKLSERLIVVSDEIFQHFCENACEVVTRIGIDNETGTVKDGALFNMEQVPSETLFYSLILASKNDGLDKLKTGLTKQDFLQIGGDATIGLGFCSVICLEVNS